MSRDVNDLEPVTRGLCLAFLDDVRDAGLKVRITDTLRTMERQRELWEQGRTTPGPVVTWARPGQSPHNYGMAFDICFEGKTQLECYPPADDPRWARVGAIGVALGLVWGGGWQKKRKDRPHFERADWKAQRSAGAIS